MTPTAPAPGVQNVPDPTPCYNCGATGHFFTACPEPTRNPPFGLAAAQAKAMASAQGQNPQGSFKRQKIGSGPVVTRYPVPGPVITKYGPPPQGMPFHGTHGPQPQFAPQYPQQPLAPTHNFQQPQPNYGPQGYAPQPQYPQYAQYPAPVPQNQLQAYGPGSIAQQPLGYGQNVALQNPYGYGAPQQYYQQQPPFINNGYNASPTGHYGQPLPPQQLQQNSPYFNGQAPYQQPYPMQSYQPGYIGPPSQVQQFGSGPQPQYSFPPQQGPPQGYPGSQGQPFSPQSHQYPNQQPQYWQHGPALSPPMQAPNSVSDATSTAIGGAAVVSVHGLPHADDGAARVPPVNFNAPKNLTKSRSRTSSVEQTAGENAGENAGSVRPFFKATPIIDPFDIEWEDSIKNYEYPQSIRGVAIATPITLKHEEFPALCPAGSTEISSKYVRPQNLDVFILPIEKSLHWPVLEKDPAFAKIDESLPCISEEDWVEYQQARRQHYDSLQNSPSPEIPRDSIENVRLSQPQPQAQSRGSSTPRGRSGSVAGYSRSRSRTPNLRNRRTPGFDADGDDDTWAPRGSVSGHVTPQLDDQKEALLATLGASGLPNPAVEHDIATAGELQIMPGTSRAPSRQDSGYASGRPSISTAGSTYSAKIGPPPPPPPSGRRPRGYGGYGSRQQSPEYGSSRSHNSSRNQSRSASTNRTPDESPLSPTSAALLGQIPMEEETNGRKRRQGDDHYVRRRPQPRVAEAFSRRW